MTPNDAQIDLLLLRHATEARGGQATEHLDADELNAFAEGSLSQAARARYVSHLADCDDCRKIATQLVLASGPVIMTEAVKLPDSQSHSWWKSLSGFFSPLRLRYAAFAVIVVAVAGVAFLVFRRPAPAPALITQNEQTRSAPASAVNPDENASATRRGEFKQALEERSQRPSPASSPLQSYDELLNKEQVKSREQAKAGDTATSTVKAAKEAETRTATESTTSPALAYKKAAEPGQASSSYAPPPPSETQRAENQIRVQQGIGGVTTVSGPRKSDQADKQQAIGGVQGREDKGKDIRSEDDKRLLSVNSAPASRAPEPSKSASVDEKSNGPRRDVDNVAANDRNSNDVRKARKTAVAANAKTESAEEKAPETRSVGGRKFKRQGNAWVDSKFKSSMPLKNIARGSSEFDALDSGLRSIAHQISGEVIVVWKGKAYLIR